MLTSEVILKECAAKLTSLLIITNVRDKEELLTIAQSINDVSDETEEYTEDEKLIYEKLVDFIKYMWQDDFDKILKIVFEE